MNASDLPPGLLEAIMPRRMRRAKGEAPPSPETRKARDARTKAKKHRRTMAKRASR